MKHWQAIILSAGIMAAVELGAAVPTGRIVATGLGVTVYQSELDDAYRRYVMAQATRGINVAPIAANAVQKELLNDLIMQQLLKRRAQAGDRTKASIDAGKKVKELRDAFLTDTAYRLHLESNGMTPLQLQQQLELELLAENVSRRELQSKIQAKESELIKFYNDANRKGQWDVRAHATVKEVFISKVNPATGVRLNPQERAKKQATAAEVFAKASAGIDFKQLVKEYSENPYTKALEGDLLLVAGQSDEKLEKAVFALQVNQISNPLESEAGFHIVKMIELKAAHKKQFAEVREEIRKHLQAVAYAKALPGYFERMKKDSAVRILLGD